MNFRLAILLISSGLLEAAVLSWLIRVSERRGWLDLPGGRKTHSHPTSFLGGIGILITLVFSLFFSAFLFPEWVEGKERMLLLGGCGLFSFTMIGLFDDLREISAKGKIFFQLLVGFVVILLLPEVRHALSAHVQGPDLLKQIITFVFPLAWIVLISNATNIIDGMDGLGALACFFPSVSLAVLNAPFGSLGSSVFLLFACLLLVFLYFNITPARIFLGNNGSMLLGFLFSFSSIFALTGRTGGKSIVFLTLIFAYPLLDVIFSVQRRIRNKKSIFSPDASHIHHRLRSKFPRKGAALFLLGIYLLICQITAIAFYYSGMESAMAFIAIATVLLFQLMGDRSHRA